MDSVNNSKLIDQNRQGWQDEVVTVDTKPISSVISDNTCNIKIYAMDDIVGPINTTISNVTPIHQSLNLREALNGIDDLIIKLKSKKKSIPLSQEGYRDIVSIYSDVIKDLIDYKDKLDHLNAE